MAKRKMRKEGLPIDGCQLMEMGWGYKIHPTKTPSLFILCEVEPE